jgi:hypothetical protein
MKRLRRLCEATRAISPAATITLRGVPDRDDLWVVKVSVGEVILLETGAGLLDKVIVEAAKKLQSLSQRVLLAAVGSGDGPESGPDDSSPPASTIPSPPRTPRIP